MIRFSKREGKLEVEYYCPVCNDSEDITILVDVLCKYGLNDCPDELYQAWKILRLGTTEYRRLYGVEKEHQHISSANKEVNSIIFGG